MVCLELLRCPRIQQKQQTKYCTPGYVYILRCDIEMEMHNVSETDSLNDSLNTKVLFEVHQTHLVWARDNGLATLY